jgi:bis(5'-nucleosyl)-tetraphosphatase (symmetrical)
MTTYFIGDVHGCYKELKELLSDISFNPKDDTLWFGGDTINKGPKSYDVISYIMDLPHADMVLGNHDMHFLALSQGLLPENQQHTLTDILNAPNLKDIIAWVRNRKFLHIEGNNALVHAGIHPSWSIADAAAYSAELTTILQSDGWITLLKNMYGDTPSKWHTELEGHEHTRCLINIFTRMRFLSSELELDFVQTGHPNDTNQLIPWYDIKNNNLQTTKVFFGHWAMLRGNSNNQQCIAIDGGCVYGGNLIARKIP